MSGCLDSLTNSNSDDFWGENCADDESGCPENPAPAFVLINQNNEVVNLSQFEGKVVVMTFLFTHCPDVCPALTYQMKRLAEELGDDYETLLETPNTRTLELAKDKYSAEAFNRKR